MKKYSVEELDELHDTFRKIGHCDGYCAECGVTSFFNWLIEVDKLQCNLTKQMSSCPNVRYKFSDGIFLPYCCLKDGKKEESLPECPMEGL